MKIKRILFSLIVLAIMITVNIPYAIAYENNRITSKSNFVIKQSNGKGIAEFNIQQIDNNKIKESENVLSISVKSQDYAPKELFELVDISEQMSFRITKYEFKIFNDGKTEYLGLYCNPDLSNTDNYNILKNILGNSAENLSGVELIISEEKLQNVIDIFK
ncbi:MAG: hypothetical protein PHY15_01950 [Eubacteriales bacterium]|nr:hypothetical protein [Eubacteriales bacterium]MDD4475611.1 hypothetical protein [Eubacteriales bacterium]